MKVHYLQHVPFEGPGYIIQWLKEHHHTISATRFYEACYSLPLIDDIDALIIMGGPMSVYDDEQYSWLKDEKDFILACINAEKPILGICLGAQLIALCLGGTIHKAPNKEIGWCPVYPTEDCKNITWFYSLFKDCPTVFHWHGEQFTIPASSDFNLLYSDANNNQAFIYKHNIIALQFHIEIDEQAITAIIENCADDLIDGLYVQTEDLIPTDALHIAHAQNIAAQLLQHIME